ncbi:MAG: hypothetical protein IH969_07980, partial [Candidatus Krumholzibacteriota bacterium]|nr:hypothetical protein [Candidatus Krumholzibacteriota bacterium]
KRQSTGKMTSWRARTRQRLDKWTDDFIAHVYIPAQRRVLARRGVVLSGSIAVVLVCAGLVLGGRTPFEGRTPQALLAKRITGKPRALRTIDESIPLYAQRAVERALATEPSERFGSPTEFAQTLTSQTVVERVGRRHLAVLPLENLSGESEEEYFVDGMTEALITSLAKVRAWRVVSRTSIMRFKGTNRSLAAIAAELGVD